MTRGRHVLQGHLGAVFCFGTAIGALNRGSCGRGLTPSTFLKDSRNGSA